MLSTCIYCEKWKNLQQNKPYICEFNVSLGPFSVFAVSHKKVLIFKAFRLHNRISGKAVHAENPAFKHFYSSENFT